MIPSQLENGKLILLKGQTKIPFAEHKGDQWHVHNSTDEKISLWTGNLGFVCGSDNIRVVDIEGISKGNIHFEALTKALDSLETFKVGTPSDGYHYYIRNSEEYDQAYFNITIAGTKCGEFRARDCYVVAPNSKVNEKTYTVVNDSEIKEVSLEKIRSLLNIPHESKKNVLLTEKISDETRSGKEFAEVCRLQKKNIYLTGHVASFEEINNEMQPFTKWTTAHQQYRETTYKNATEKILSEPEKTPVSKAQQETEIVKELKELDLRDLSYLFHLKKDKRFLVQGMLYPKTVIMVYSPPAHFKSLLCLYLGLCVSSGQDFLGLKTKKATVLICDKENNEQSLSSRLKAINRGQKFNAKNPLKFLIRQGDLDNHTFVEQLKATVKKNNVKLVILDTLHRFSNYDENAANDLNTLYTTVFSPLVSENDCTVLFLTHTTKSGNDYRGSSDLMGMVDAAFSVKRTPKTGRFSLENVKARWGEIETISGEIDFQGEDDTEEIRFNRISSEQENQDKKTKISKIKEVTAEIRKLFPMVGTVLKRNAILTHFELLSDPPSEATIKRSIEYLVTNDYLISEKKGVYTRVWSAISDQKLDELTKKPNDDNQAINQVSINKENKPIRTAHGSSSQKTAHENANGSPVQFNHPLIKGDELIREPCQLQPSLNNVSWVRAKLGSSALQVCMACGESKPAVWQLELDGQLMVKFCCADCDRPTTDDIAGLAPLKSREAI